MKLDGQTVVKSLALGAGAVFLPALLRSFTTTLASIPFWNTDIGIAGVTAGALILAGVGAGLVDQLFFSK